MGLQPQKAPAHLMIGITHLPQYVLLLLVSCHQQDSKDAGAMYAQVLRYVAVTVYYLQ